MQVSVRTATLEDIADIVAVHKTDVEEWKRPYSELSVVDRWYYGGPWMSIETCAVHVNFLIKQQQYVLVAEVESRVVGECEVYVGPTLDGCSKNANISVLYVHKDYHGRGIGTALLKAAEQVALEEDCRSLTLYNPASVQFYRRIGLEIIGRQQHLLISCRSYKHSYEICETTSVPDYSELQRLRLLVGQYHSPWQMYLSHRFIQEVGYALPLPRYQRQWCLWLSNHNRRAFAVIYPVTSDYSQAKLLLFADVLTVDLARAVVSYASQRGIRQLQLLVEEQEISRLKHALDAAIKPGQLILGKNY